MKNKHLIIKLFSELVVVLVIIVCILNKSTSMEYAPVEDLSKSEKIIHNTYSNPERVNTLVTTKSSISTKHKNKKKKLKVYTRYTTTRVNVRVKPNTNSKVVKVLDFDSKVRCSNYNKNWSVIQINNKEYYIYKKFLSKTRTNHKTYNIPIGNGWKSWMPYTSITSRSSNQLELQINYAYTGNYGIRMINNRYCVALGSYFKCEIGQYFTLILQNDTAIPCIMSDSKSDKHTDSTRIFTRSNGCMSEFIVDSYYLNKNAKSTGNISDTNKSWCSPVKKVIIYDYNVLE